MRTYVYIDAFNLYYGCLKGSKCKWLDLAAFCRASLPTNQILQIRYFTALVSARPNDPHQPIRQQTYLRAVRTFPDISIHLGHYLETKVRMKVVNPPASGADKVLVYKTEEKGSDVNLASYLLMDGFENLYDAAVVVSNDSDLAEPINLVRKRLNKRVVVLLPCAGNRRPSVQLQKVAAKSWKVDLGLLASCQLPRDITDDYGTISKPASW